jgi:hypothetical protein
MVPDGQTGSAPLDVASLDLILTPRGHLLLTETEDAPALDPGVADRLRRAFDSGTGCGLLQLGAGEV